MQKFKFTVGPWNVHEGADAFGPVVRESIPLEEKFVKFKAIGLDGVQFHDDDAVPAINSLNKEEIIAAAQKVKRSQLRQQGRICGP
jgi:xylose isomerase